MFPRQQGIQMAHIAYFAVTYIPCRPTSLPQCSGGRQRQRVTVKSCSPYRRRPSLWWETLTHFYMKAILVSSLLSGMRWFIHWGQIVIDMFLYPRGNGKSLLARSVGHYSRNWRVTSSNPGWIRFPFYISSTFRCFWAAFANVAVLCIRVMFRKPYYSLRNMIVWWFFY